MPRRPGTPRRRANRVLVPTQNSYRQATKIYSVDRNWFDLARTLQFFGNSNFAFGSTAGDDFESPTFHVNGGIGLFGSAAVDEIGFTIHPRP
jgi:hypothetical protein